MSHPYLKELAEFKKKMGQRIARYFLGLKGKSISHREQSARAKGKVVFISANFNKRTPVFFIKSKRKFSCEKFLIFKDTKDIVSSCQWL